MKLVAFFSLDAAETPDGRVDLTHKIVDGLSLMARRWPGELVAVFSPRCRMDTNLDHAAFSRSELPFEVVVQESRRAARSELVRSAALVQLGVDHRHARIARACLLARVPYVVVAEYDLKTRLQIAAAEEESFARRARRMAWELRQEAVQRTVIAAAAGLQCNGVPAWDAWARLTPDPLLFFDSRVEPEMLATESDLAGRGTQRALRLAFSGRLIPMKGVQHLPALALRLRERGVPFTLRIWGSGPLEEELRREIAAHGLGDQVTMEGALPFAALMDVVRGEVDLFVCPHVQGDPSCTYVETLACGVPIVGFANDAWRGLLARTGAGWSVPLGDVEALARTVDQLATDRASIAARAARALDFAREHTFGATFARRMVHLEQIARASLGAARAA